LREWRDKKNNQKPNTLSNNNGQLVNIKINIEV